ncbi:MAG: GNAT family N-acetyltransferase [Pseudomonadota bacterium]
MKTHFATLKNINSIRKILQENLVDIDDSRILSERKNNGFLVRNISEKEIEELILDEKNHLVLVAEKDGEVLGYLIASRFTYLPENLQNGVLSCLQMKKITDFEQIIYHRQIAVKSGFKGIGGVLLAEFLTQAKLKGFKNVLCRIVHQPIHNQRSILFHQKFGFGFLGEIGENNLIAGLYLKNLD